MSNAIKSLIAFLVVMSVLITVFVMCYLIVQDSTSSPESQKWAMACMSGIAGGLVVYSLKKK